MPVDNKLFDDLARVAGGALGALSTLREEAETRMRQQFEQILGRMDLVRREEFDAVQAIAAKARAEQEVLAERVTALEASMATLLADRALLHEDAGPRRKAASAARPHTDETEPAGDSD